MCLLGDIVQYGLLGEKGCNFIMTSALRQHWKILASAHHLIMVHYIYYTLHKALNITQSIIHYTLFE